MTWEPSRKEGRVFWLWGLTAVLLTLHGGPALPGAGQLSPRLESFYQDWLMGVEPLMVPGEREAFLNLGADTERELFMRRFWEARVGPTRGLRVREIGGWQRSFEQARAGFGLDEDRGRALVLAGTPLEVASFWSCGNVMRQLEIWTYRDETPDSTQAEASVFSLVFFRYGSPDRGAYRHWDPDAGARALIFGDPEGEGWSVDRVLDYAERNRCYRRGSIGAQAFAVALRSAVGRDELRLRRAPLAAAVGWLEALAHELSDPAAPRVRLDLSYPGRYQQKTVFRGRLRVGVEHLARNVEGALYDRLTILGDVLLGDRLVDSFEVVHHLAGSAPASGFVELDFFRRLRPGAYRLRVRLADGNGLALLREDKDLEVPRLEEEAEAPAGQRKGIPGLTRSEVGMLTTFPSIELRLPSETFLVGAVDVSAATHGGPIERVDFYLDGELVKSDEEPPYSAAFDFGPEPEHRVLEAFAIDPGGKELARHRAEVNAGPVRFAVRLVEPLVSLRGDRALAEVDVPAGEVLERVDFYLAEELLATLIEPPFEVALPSSSRAPFVRVVATLTGGESREDLVFLEEQRPQDRIDVQLVELYTTVLDRHGRPVTGLQAEDFRVLEDGNEQILKRFATIDSLAINVALLMDTSSSMRSRVRIAARSARRFFETVLRPGDQAALTVFNHDIRRIVPFTGRRDDLHRGTLGLRAWGTTRLHDGLVFTLHGFAGLGGRRALVLLSDGEDVDSDFPFEQVLESALRAEVTVYPILLDVGDEATIGDLERLANETGGAAFRIAGTGELGAVYQRLEEELRSQYLLVYEPSQTGDRKAFREVRVELGDDGLRARTLRGYYP